MPTNKPKIARIAEGLRLKTLNREPLVFLIALDFSRKFSSRCLIMSSVWAKSSRSVCWGIKKGVHRLSVGLSSIIISSTIKRQYQEFCRGWRIIGFSGSLPAKSISLKVENNRGITREFSDIFVFENWKGQRGITKTFWVVLRYFSTVSRKSIANFQCFQKNIRYMQTGGVAIFFDNKSWGRRDLQILCYQIAILAWLYQTMLSRYWKEEIEIEKKRLK